MLKDGIKSTSTPTHYSPNAEQGIEQKMQNYTVMSKKYILTANVKHGHINVEMRKTVRDVQHMFKFA